MKSYLVAAFLVLSPAIAMAQPAAPPQQPAPLPTPDSLDGALGAQVNATVAQLQTALTSYRRLYAEAEALKKHIADMDAYLKACGDKPGCTQPIEPPGVSGK